MPLITPNTAQRNVINTWLDNYVTRPHPLLGREGAVCPYVPAARRQGSVLIRVAATLPAGDPRPRDRLLTTPDAARTWLRSVFDDALQQFENHPWPRRGRHLNSLVVVLQDLGPEHWAEIDRSHAEVKTEVMARGLMAGQFHPHCPAPAAHNAAFPVNCSPVPLIVIRRMARHDHLFAEDPIHIQAYERHFRTDGPDSADHPDSSPH
ncbi:DUF6875 domain-containing protein [Streptomyces sp. NPDC001787]|uniref:DUF6875 domain-containing protein n=1 Tax=Streptomyces sp. NPDC001787 TaxID=3154523 RepID=UPI003329012A